MAKRRLTRAQWLDAHHIEDEALREETLKNFRNSDDIQAFIDAVRTTESDGPTDDETILRLPAKLGEKPPVVLEWLEALAHPTLSTVQSEGTVDTAETAIDAYRTAEVPISYVHGHPLGLVAARPEQVIEAWKLDLSHDDLRPYTQASDFDLEAVKAFLDAGVPADYLMKLSSLPDTLNNQFIITLYSEGIDAESVANRFAADPDTTEEDILGEVDTLTPELWNAFN